MARGKKKEKILTPEEKLQEILVTEDACEYQIPSNWRWIILGNLVGIKRGASPRPIKNYITDDESGVNWIKIGDSDSGKYITHIKEKITEEGAKKSVFVKKGTLLLSNSMSFGRPYILDVDGCIHDGWLAITPCEAISKEYLYYALLASEWYFERVAVGTAVRNLNSVRVAATPVPLPPLPEQKRIVDRIESLFAKLDEAKEKAQAVVDGFEDRKAAILHKAFTGELTCCESDIYTVYITDVIKNEKNALKAGPFGSALRKDMYVSSGYKIYGQEQVINGDEGIGDYYIDEEKYKELIACKVAPGDVLISLVGTVGKVLVLSKNCQPGIINPRLIKVSLDEDKMLPLYFKYYFESGYLKSLYKSDAHGTTMDVLNMGILKKLPFPLVGIDKQKEIIMTLNTLLNNDEQAIEYAEQVIAQIDTMKKSILARAFRGELGTNNLSDESAEELLKKII